MTTSNFIEKFFPKWHARRIARQADQLRDQYLGRTGRTEMKAGPMPWYSRRPR